MTWVVRRTYWVGLVTNSHCSACEETLWHALRRYHKASDLGDQQRLRSNKSDIEWHPLDSGLGKLHAQAAKSRVLSGCGQTIDADSAFQPSFDLPIPTPRCPCQGSRIETECHDPHIQDMEC